MYNKKKGGFTLIELLVVIAIIGLLSSVVLTSLSTARTKSKIARVQSDFVEYRKAIAFLEDDTGETVGHFALNSTICPSSANPNEIYLDTGAAGLEQTDGSFPNWQGPYIRDVVLDPWDNRYVFDDDYTCAADVLGCLGTVGDTRALQSGGPNGSGINVYDSDNIVLVLCRR